MKVMNTFLSPPSFRIHAFVLAGALTAFLACSGCGHKTAGPSASVKPVSASRNPLAIALATHVGTDRMDEEIRRCQERVRAGDAAPGTLERLGWLYVGKARSACDPGFYLLAEQCAFALEEREPGSSAALLLRGHTLQSRHRFTEAEPVARTLVARRGLSFDHGLLGDILVDLGRVEEAAAAYQSMMDLKPDPQGYARVANIRWLRGDLEGALEAIRVAAWGASPSDPESAAWLNTQLARLLWQSGNAGAASGALNIALGFHPGHAAALLLRGRMLLASGETEKAVETLREAARLNPLPEAQWALAEALRATHREEQAG